MRYRKFGDQWIWRRIGLPMILCLACTAPEFARGEERLRAAELPGVRTVSGDRVYNILPPDGIPAIDDPHLVGADEADFMKDDEPVVGIARNGEAKAYSLWGLDRHEIVNDVIDGEPIAVTW